MHTEGYKDVNVTNMTTSWSDGLAFCALLHRFRPDLIDFDSLSKENVFYNNDLAFSVAERELDIAALLDAEDMTNMKVPDKLSVMTYLSQYYNCFRNCNPADAPVPDVPVVNANSLRRNNDQGTKLSEKEQSEENICAICGKRVHLVQRYFEKGKLYHRTCHRNDSLEKLRSKKFFRPAGNEEEADSDNTGDVKTSQKDAKHRRLDESTMSEAKQEQHTAEHVKQAANGHVQNAENHTKNSPRSSPAKSTLAVQEPPADQPVSPKPRARKISAQKQEAAQPNKLPNAQSRPVATPRSRGSSNASKPSIKVEEPPPAATNNDALNPFGTSGSDSDTTLSSTSSSEEEENPVRRTQHGTTGISKEKTETAKKPSSEDDESHEQEGLNPFGDVDDATEDDGQEVPERAERENPFDKDDGDEDQECLNPFGEVEEEDGKSKESSDNEGNPFGEFSDEEELENEGNPFGEYEEKKPPARPPPPKVSVRERHNPFTGDGKVDIFQDAAAKDSKKKKRPAPVPPKSASSAPQRPPSWKGSPEKKTIDAINMAAERKMKEINKANATDPKFGRAHSKKPAPPPPPSKSPANMARKSVPPPVPKSPTKAGGVKHTNSPAPEKRERNDKKPTPPRNIRSTRAAPGHGYPLIKRKVERKMSESSIANELEVLDVQLSDLEVKGVKLEGMLRFTMDKDMDWTKEEDELLQEWFELVSKKNMLLRRESELVFLMQQQKLEEEHADIEFQLRKLLNKPDSTKTDQDKLDEEKLLQRLLEVVESRNVIINSIEEERIKEAEEDSAYEKLKKLQDNPNKKKKKNKVKKIFSKRDKKEKQGKVKDA